MKSQSDNKETLSRRGFSKSIAAAFASIPFASLLADAQRRRGQRRARTRGAQSSAAMASTANRNEHDTPPPVLFLNGSFIVETVDDFALGDIVSVGMKKRHNIKPSTATNNRVFPAHIKVVDGSGEMLYRLDTKDIGLNPHPAEAIKITALLKDGTTVEAGSSTVVSNMQTFAIDTDNGKSLLQPTMVGDLPVGNKRHARRRVKRDAGDMSDTSIQHLTIMSGTNVLYSISPPSDLASGGDELRIMIWLEEKKVP